MIKESVSNKPIKSFQIIDKVYQLIKSKLVFKKIQIIFDLSKNISHILGDEIQLQQILLNLLLNACQATEKKGDGDRGLAINRALIENHGGKLWAESKEGKGATFFIRLPISS